MKICNISDTHGLHLNVEIPECDLLIHAGDTCNIGSLEDLKSFLIWYDKQTMAITKLFIAGNHCRCLDNKFGQREKALELISQYPNIIYLENSFLEVCGIKIWGSPITPDFFPEYWAFNKPRGIAIQEVWDTIPEGIDIIVTHGPVYGILDKCKNGHVGCENLRETITRLKPKYHVAGHIHEGYGTQKYVDTIFINPSICDKNYKPINKPIIFDI